MEAKEKAKAAPPLVSDQDVNEKLKGASNVAKEAVETQGHRTPPEVVLNNVDKSVGRKKVKGGEKWDVSSGKEAGTAQKEEVKKTDEEKDVEMELNSILKRSPSESISSHI